MAFQVNKFMCTVETKNYPVLNIYPNINRYGTIRKKLSIPEIANCLASFARVVLHKDNGNNVILNQNNYREVLLTYKNELENKKENEAVNKKNIKNAKALESIKENNKKSKPAPKKVEEPVVVEEKPTTPEPTPVTEEPKREELAANEATDTVTESVEVAQADPEDPATSDWSHIYEEEDKKENKE